MNAATLFPDDLGTHDSGGRTLPLPVGVRATAIYGGPRDCHRYLLDWLWDDSLPCLLAGMMNPSSATHRVSDGTLSWLHRWACRNGFGRQIVVNGSSYRCRDQARLAEVEATCGPDNHMHIRIAARIADVIVVGYGQPKVRAVRPHGPRMVEALREAGKPIHIWALSKDGTPKHPLYLPGAVPLTVWQAALADGARR